MDDTARKALARDRVIDITTTGRKSGRPRRVEIWYHRVGGRIYISGLPGRRDWYANLQADPRFTFHLKQSTRASLPAVATLITDSGERRRIFAAIVSNPRHYEKWVAGSPLVEVTFLEE
jgi:deazaflavin-dependent oxidoreductase (nitroreductase family)